MADKTPEYRLNRVDGFNPYEHLENAVDREGQPIFRKNGEPLRYLTTDAKTFWFRCVHPEGSLRVFAVPVETGDCGMTARYRAEVRFNADDSCPVAEWQHQETVWDLSELDIAVSRAQTIALGKALSRAGFGCEIESFTGALSEGENPGSLSGREQKPEPKKKAEPEESSITEIEALMDRVNEEISSEEKKPEEDENALSLEKKLEEAKAFVISCTEDAPVTIRSLEGKTVEEAISERPRFASYVLNKENVRNSLTAETVEAVKLVAEHIEGEIL